MSRSGRYTKHLQQLHLDQTKLASLHELTLHDFKRYEKNLIHPAVLIGNYLLRLNQMKSLTQWKGSNYLWFCPNTEDEFLTFWGSTLIRSLPLKINQVLVNWYLGYYSLSLITFLPSAEDMLQKQSVGARYLTLLIQLDQWRSFSLEGRDAYSLVVHDLIHAHEFFSHEASKQQQILFYQKMLRLYPHLIQENQDELFLKDLHYLISDMNTHPAHLEAYWSWLRQKYLAHDHCI